ncbi:putative prolyl 4-hydroxylase 3 [Chlorella sorokiniana]|uniref:Prolyl 4-hydroxylase 3 n=1 Tax=Chlorella sorokiniana TaxID=3076 RepID=A0A2P6U0E1_CHLSO|nr:putative prolyl 4-hydroxylase 3 [Chlorella sorokiniana]|eukprot:PRW59787.1 putative prolyl 4-hydroxylase 3 [Chlorella sorokiniana]
MPAAASPSKPTRRRAAVAAPAEEEDELDSPVSSHPLQAELPAATPSSTARIRAAKPANGGGGLGRGAVLALIVALLAAAGGALYTQPGARDQLQAGLQVGRQLSSQALANLGATLKFSRTLLVRMWLGVPADFLDRLDLPDETLSKLGASPEQPVDGPPRKQQQREPRAGEVPADSVPRKQQPREARAAEEAAGEAAEGAPRRQQRREARSTDGVDPIPQPVPQLPPLPPITQAEIEVFEQATAEHYAMNADEGQDRQLLEEQQAAEGQAGSAQAFVPGTGADAEAAAAATFDAAVHQQYLDLPAWPQPTEAELKGGWNLTEAIYDYSAQLPMAQVLSWERPRLVTFPSFLSPAEVGHMITISRDHLERSEVLVEAGKETKSDVRTSFGFWPEQDAVTARIQERIHRTLGIPEPFGEGLYVLNYQIGQKYDAHNDHVMDGSAYLKARNNVAEPVSLDFLKRAGGPACGPGKGGPTCGDRVGTFIIYLKSPKRGGTTAFPEAELTKQAMGAEHRPGTDPDEWYCRDERVLAASPPPGTGVLFWDYRPHNGGGTGSYEDGSADPLATPVYEALHSGCPVVDGEKFVATRWIRGARFY